MRQRRRRLVASIPASRSSSAARREEADADPGAPAGVAAVTAITRLPRPDQRSLGQLAAVPASPSARARPARCRRRSGRPRARSLSAPARLREYGREPPGSYAASCEDVAQEPGPQRPKRPRARRGFPRPCCLAARIARVLSLAPLAKGSAVETLRSRIIFPSPHIRLDCWRDRSIAVRRAPAERAWRASGTGASLAWRTRREHDVSPNRVSYGHGFHNDERPPVHLQPPHRSRAAITLDRPRLVEDLVVLLRRQWRG